MEGGQIFGGGGRRDAVFAAGCLCCRHALHYTNGVTFRYLMVKGGVSRCFGSRRVRQTRGEQGVIPDLPPVTE